jgi:hypothetical protein
MIYYSISNPTLHQSYYHNEISFLMAVDKVLGISYSSVSKVVGIAKASISKIDGITASAGGGTGQFTLGLFSGGGAEFITGYSNIAATSITEGGGNDIKFKITWGSTGEEDQTGGSPDSTQAVGTGNSKKYAGIKFAVGFGEDTGAVDLVQLVVTAVATSTNVKAQLYTTTAGGSPSPNVQLGGDSDAVSLAAGAGTYSFTWSSSAPSLASAATAYWIVFVDQS